VKISNSIANRCWPTELGVVESLGPSCTNMLGAGVHHAGQSPGFFFMDERGQRPIRDQISGHIGGVVESGCSSTSRIDENFDDTYLQVETVPRIAKVN
jgi:hypothetical protein